VVSTGVAAVTATASTGGSWAGTTAEERRADRRSRLLDAGLEAFGTEGYASSAINRICKAARVTERDLYREFGGKRGLFIAVYDALIAEVFARIAAELAEVPPEPEARIRAAADAFTTVVTADPRKSRVNFVEAIGSDPEIESHRRAAMRAFGALIETQWRELEEQGATEHGPAPGLSMALVGATQELLVDWVGDPGDRTRGDVVDAIVRVHLAVMRHA
jgi:AcrR family transcriptional regulator